MGLKLRISIKNGLDQVIFKKALDELFSNYEHIEYIYYLTKLWILPKAWLKYMEYDGLCYFHSHTIKKSNYM